MTGINNLLESLGLTKQETRCYLALHELGFAKAGQIATKARIATPNMYPVLATLTQKGIISHTLRNNTRTYQTTSPDALLELIQAQKESLIQREIELKKTIKELQKAPKEQTREPYKYFEGIHGIKSMWHQITQEMPNLKPQTLRIYAAPKQSTERLLAFYNEFQTARIEHGIHYKLILNSDLKDLGKLRQKQPLTQVRYLTITGETTIATIKPYTIMYYTIAKKPISILINDEHITNTNIEIFEHLWKQAKIQ